ncbi:MAG: 4-alpha-glucanotransferase, partial [Clostridia bacterium]|nr:4-alpha-glucanotransferase [Clostridia bacterium]
KVSYTKIKTEKQKLLKLLFNNLSQDELKSIKTTLKNKQNLIDFAYFKTVLNAFGTENFREVPSQLWDKNNIDYKTFFKEHEKEILVKAHIQFVLENQWKGVRHYANQQGIKIIGDLPIYPNPNSFDVLSNRTVFKVNKKTLEPLVYGGVPGDDFTPNGQMWGTCVYDWNSLEKNDFNYMINKINNTLNNYAILRLDHFFGYIKHYEWNAKTLNQGKWVKSNGKLFFEKLKKEVDFKKIVVEDLGFDFKEAADIKINFNLKGMSVLQMLFENDKYLPKNTTKNDIYYLGTHDNNTFVGFYNSLSLEKQKEFCEKVKIPFSKNASQVLIKTIKTMQTCNSEIIILQIQDLLKQDSKQRMNIPGVAKNCWEYKVPQNYQTSILKTLNQIKKRL